MGRKYSKHSLKLDYLYVGFGFLKILKTFYIDLIMFGSPTKYLGTE